MIHFLDQYDMVENSTGKADFVIDGVYLWMAQTLPSDECDLFEQMISKALSDGGWMQISKNIYRKDCLQLTIDHYERHPEDIRVGRELPDNYRTVEYTMVSDGMEITERMVDSPWNCLNSGIRKMGTRMSDPTIAEDYSILKDYFPFQVELGGGASIELGIPPLNHLHRIYNVTKIENGNFVFGDDPFLAELLTDPIAFYQKAGGAYKSCILAEPNEFYLLLRRLFEEGLAVGNVITNNFDGVASLVGLKEQFIRRYDEPKQFPMINFDDRAKSLLVIGSHADRRHVQKQAREKGLKVIYVDPETYYNYYGELINYPLEHIQAGDLLFHRSAVEFAKGVNEMLEHEQSQNRELTKAAS